MKQTLKIALVVIFALVLSMSFVACDSFAPVYNVTVVGGSGTGEYEVNTEATVTAEVPEGKRFDKWVDANGELLSEEATYTFTVTADVSLTAQFINVYTVEVTGGTGAGTYDENAEVTVTAEVPAGKKFAKWVDAENAEVATTASYTFTVTANVSLTAQFINLYTVEVTGGTGAGTYDENAEVTVTAEVPAGKKFAKWVDAENVEVATTASYTFNVTANVSLTAVFTNVYTVEVTGGTGAGTYDENAEATVTAEVPAGKRFVKWVVDGEQVATTESYTFTVTANVSLLAVCIDVYTVEVTGGTGAGTYDVNTEVTVTAEVPAGKYFVKWTNANGEEVSTTASYTFAVAGNVSLTAVFANLYTLTVNGGEGSGEYAEGTTVTVTATVPYDKAFVKWVDADENEVATTVSFEVEVTANAVYTAVFEDLEWVTKKFEKNEDFAEGSAQFSYVNNAFKISDSGVTTATTKDSYGVMEMTYVMSGMDYMGDAGSNFTVVFNNGWQVKYMRLYGWIALFPVGESEVPSISIDHTKTYKVRIKVAETKIGLYVAILDAETNEFGEETTVSEFDALPSASPVTISSYNSSVILDDLSISYYGKPVGDETVQYGKKEITSVNDFTANSGALTFDETTGKFKVSDGGTVTGALKGTFTQFVFDFTVTGLDYWGVAGANFRWKFGDVQFYISGHYYFATFFDTTKGESESTSGMPSMGGLNKTSVYNFRIVQTANKITLYGAKEGEELARIRTIERTACYTVIEYSSYGNGMSISNMAIETAENIPNVYKLTVNDGEGSGEYVEGTTVTLTATVPEGSTFVKWVDADGNEVATELSFDVVVTEDAVYTAVFANLEWVTKKFEKNEDFAEGSAQFTYENGAFRITNSGVITATTKDAYGVMEMTYVMSKMSYYGAPDCNFTIIFNNGWQVKYMYYYGWIALFPAGVSSGVNSIDISSANTYKIRIAVTETKIGLYVATLNTETNEFGEETIVSEYDATPNATPVKISSYNSSVLIDDLSISYFGKPIDEPVEELKWVTKKFEKNEDFAEGSAQFTYENGAFRITNSGVIKATTKDAYGVMEMTYVMSRMDYYGAPDCNFTIIFNNGWQVKYMYYYGWIALFPAGVSSGVNSIDISSANTYKIRIAVTETKIGLYVATLNTETNEFGEETIVSEYDATPNATPVEISSYNSSVLIDDLSISYFGTPVEDEEATPATKNITSLDDFTANSGALTFDETTGKFKVSDGGLVTGALKGTYDEFTFNFTVSGLDFWGVGGANFRWKFGDVHFYISGHYYFATFFDSTVESESTSGMPSMGSLTKADVYNFKIVQTADSISLYGAKDGEELALIRTIERTATPTIIEYSSYGNGMYISNMSIVNYAK